MKNLKLLDDSEFISVQKIRQQKKENKKNKAIIFPENTEVSIQFNVMPQKNVQEKMHIKEYRVLDDHVEALFDREYISEMKKSPSHLIFLTLLCHTQKLLYFTVCQKLGLPYDPHGEELFKIWPTKFNLDLPKLVTSKKDLVQELYLLEFYSRKENQYFAKLYTHVKNLVTFEIDTEIYMID